ncbi:MAG: M67 family metallopeptidase [Anaerolineae bacterium]|nr:M67 family metallopeptidase [Anaerolineae bacterium]NUQ03226.1 M67 family metallopeptidase [Anaerolineae bacterium]
MKVILTQTLKQQIIHQLEAAHPDEAGGFLLGSLRDDIVSIAGVVPVENVFEPTERYHRYAMTPVDWMRLEDAADARGLSLVGYYHSHPNSPAIPSLYDRDHALPNFAYLITSVMPDGAREMLAWRLQDDRQAFTADTLSVE